MINSLRTFVWQKREGMMTVGKEIQTGNTVDACVNAPDSKRLIIDMIQDMDKSDDKFLIQIYTIVHRHIEKRGH